MSKEKGSRVIERVEDALKHELVLAFGADDVEGEIDGSLVEYDLRVEEENVARCATSLLPDARFEQLLLLERLERMLERGGRLRVRVRRFVVFRQQSIPVRVNQDHRRHSVQVEILRTPSATAPRSGVETDHFDRIR